MKIWNNLEKELENDIFYQSQSKAKEAIIKFFLETY